MARDTETDDRTATTGGAAAVSGRTGRARVDDVAGRLGFHPWHLAVTLVAGFLTAWTVPPANPVEGLLGLLVAIVVWACVVRVLQGLNGVVRLILRGNGPGIMTARLYCVAALLGLGYVFLSLLLETPSPWARLTGRFTPEIAIYGFFVVGAFLALVLGLGKGLYVLGTRVSGYGD